MATFLKPKSPNFFLWFYFGTGIILGIIIGCAVTLTFAFSSLTATNYYYYYDGRTFLIRNTLPQVTSKIIEGKTYDTPLKQFPHFKEEQQDESTKEESGPDIDRLIQAHNYIKGYPVTGIAVVLLLKDRCDLLKDENYLETWGKSVALYVLVHSKCSLPTKNSHWINKNSTFYYTYSKNNFNMYQLMYKIHHQMKPKWILLLSSDTYVNVLHVNRLLDDFNPNIYHMFGSVTSGIEKKSCMNGPSLLLSKSVVKSLIENSQNCFNSDNIDNVFFDIGRCCLEMLNIFCSTRLKMVNDFNDKDIENFSAFKFINVFTIHPVLTSQSLSKIHRHFAFEKYNQTRSQLDHLSSIIKQLTPQNDNLQKISPHQYPLHISLYNDKAWVYFDSNYIYDDQYLEARLPFLLYKTELNTVLLETVRLANKDYHAPLIFNKIINGYFLRNQDGTRYIIDVEFQEVSSHSHITFQRRFSLFRPYQINFLNFPSKSLVDETVHVIVPINNVGVRLTMFFDNFGTMMKELEDPIHLIMVTYNRKDTNDCQEFVTKHQKKYHSLLRFTIVQGKGEFSRARALDTGTSILEDHHLMFFCDVDLDIGKEFFGRCKRNTIRNYQVYYPEVFKMYNMNYAYRLSQKPQRYDAIRRNGHWGHYGYGMLCMYKSDYKKVGGLDTSYMGWGGEDNDLYKRVISNGYNTLRAPEPALKHPWHSKECNGLERSKKENCIRSQSEVLADRMELGRYVYEMEMNKSHHLFCI